MANHDPWDTDPSAFDEADESTEPEKWDPDELLARAVWRGRHAGGSHLLGDWRGIYHGIRAGNAALRAEGERCVEAERLMVEAARKARLLREGKAA